MISLSAPHIGAGEREGVNRVLDSGMLAQGPEVAAFESEFSAVTGATHSIAVNSGTSALHLGLIAAGVKRGDEVIVPSFTFAATANAVSLAGATPVFADVDINDFCLDPADVIAKINERTTAIMPVHLYGHPAQMDAFTSICADHDLLLIEDAAQAHLASWNGQQVGTFGVGMFSFYPTKNMMSGEGGMITTADADLARMCRLLRNQGMERRYENEVIGFNARMTDLHAAIGRAQLEQLPDWTKRRQEIADRYSAEITSVVTPTVRPEATHVYHQYTVRVEERRDEFVEHLTSNGVGSSVYYPIPVHHLPSFGLDVTLPKTELVAAQVASIPVHPGLTDDEVGTVISVVNAWS